MAAQPAQTVLIIDDEPALRRAVARPLALQYRVLEAGSVEAGLEVLAKEPVDLVLLDVVLPGMSGREGCAKLKAAATGYLPVLLLTGLGTPDDLAQGFEAGADDFLRKPFDLQELRLRVAAFLRLRRQEQAIARQLEALRDLSGLKDDLIGVLVNDLRDPLSGIVDVFAALDGRSKDARNQLAVVSGLEAALKAIALADDLLLVRRLEQGEFTPQLELSAPTDVVRDVVDGLRPLAEARRVDVHVEGEGEVTLPIDRQLVRRAVETLVEGALQDGAEKVDVAVKPGRGGAEVTVTDLGVTSVRDGATAGRHGRGVGSYLAKLVAKAHQGALSVEPREGGGTLFRLRLGAA